MPSTSTFRQSQPLSSSSIAQSTLSVLHDHNKLMRCQPLVGHIEALSSAPDRASAEERARDHEWFRQTEYVPLLPLGLWKKKVIFENWFRDLPDPAAITVSDAGRPRPDALSNEGGVESKVYAPGLTIQAVFKSERQKSDHREDTITSRDNESFEVGDEKWQLVEETEMVCKNAIVKWLSEGQHLKAQKQMLDRIVHEAKKRLYVEAEGPGDHDTGSSRLSTIAFTETMAFSRHSHSS